jgi:hypothetical protein
MYGNIVSSNGVIDIDTLSEEEIKLEHAIYFLSLEVYSNAMIYINDDPDGIFINGKFELRDLPIFKFKVCRYGNTLPVNGKYPPFAYSYYGYY